VFDVVGQPTSRGVTWVWAREDLDRATVERAQAQLTRLFSDRAVPRRLLVYLGGDCFVDLSGLRLLLAVDERVRGCGGALAVVAPPHCLVRMLSCLGLEDRLLAFESVQHAASPGWTQPPPSRSISILGAARRPVYRERRGRGAVCQERGSRHDSSQTDGGRCRR
jgi:anti-anti-sigma factor